MDEQKLIASMMAQMASRPDLGFGPSSGGFGPDDHEEPNLDDYDNFGNKKVDPKQEIQYSNEKELLIPGLGDEMPRYGAEVSRALRAAFGFGLNAPLNDFLLVVVDGKEEKIILGNKRAPFPKAFQEAIKTMRKGEEAKISCFQTLPVLVVESKKNSGEKSPQATTGQELAAASPSPAEPERQLVGTWQIKLVEFENVDLITPDRGIYKKIIRPFKPDQPLEDRKPEFESNATFYIKIQLEDGKVVFENQRMQYVIGEESEVPRLEKCLRSMRWKEVSVFSLHPYYAFGDEGNSTLGVPPVANVRYTIELHGFDVPMSPFSCSSYAETYAEAFRRKEEGNSFFKKKLYDLATAKYTKAQLFAECAESEKLTEQQRADLNKIKLSCSLNLAFVTLRNREFAKTLIHCKGALDIEPDNLKAIYRRGMVYVYQDKWDEARADFNTILAREPNNTDTRNAIAFLDARIRQHNDRERRLFQRVFQQIDEENKKEKEQAKLEAASTANVGNKPVSEPQEEHPDEDSKGTEQKQQQKPFWKRLFSSWW